MKVYAVIEHCPDDYYSDYSIVGDRVYLSEEDAERALRERRQKFPGRYELDVGSFDLIGNLSDISKEEKEWKRSSN